MRLYQGVSCQKKARGVKIRDHLLPSLPLPLLCPFNPRRRVRCAMSKGVGAYSKGGSTP
jgi:hypothetical protein